MRLEDGYLKLKALSGQKIQIETLGANMSIGPYGTGYKLYVINTMDLGGNSIVNAVVDGYATESWVEGKGYITGVSGATGSFTTADGKTVSVSIIPVKPPTLCANAFPPPSDVIITPSSP